MNILSTRIKNKHDDLSNWINFNPILLEGEIGLVKFPDGTENMKIGNGISSFLDLPYVINPFSYISALELSVFGLSNSLSSLSTSFVELSGNVYLKDETYNRTEIDEKVEFLSGEISSLESSLISVSNSLSNYVPISGNVNVENALSISENLFVGGNSLLSIILENSSKVLLREWS